MKSWDVTLGGIRYQGKPLSGEAVRRFEEDVQAAGADLTRQEQALFRLLRLAFPLSWAVFWKGDPVRQIMASPERETLLVDFYASLPSRSRSGRKMNGTGWRLPTATR